MIYVAIHFVSVLCGVVSFIFPKRSTVSVGVRDGVVSAERITPQPHIMLVSLLSDGLESLLWTFLLLFLLLFILVIWSLAELVLLRMARANILEFHGLYFYRKFHSRAACNLC
ncbi:hypothetical protein E2C01_030175 [Portunus trituberculatus]|uniref:Uncharacterized protein n=1 Tax=Portunus trituberculatus TaxID=210409 RepID=A0A5B7EU15_PORTR|nr:hypothetical protein [Portunus trituberculatus]